ncbi:MAG: metallophosphoesterase [bacterium]|nr:metallophosphoesterase [bacterium]
MAATDTTILFVGDMHLGRLPSRVPLDPGGRLPAPAELGPGAAWRAVVEEAIARKVDAVVLAGDVMDDVATVFRGAAELNPGLERLGTEGIPVHAVAGNHDTHVLPELARRGGITLLGPGGTWSAIDVAPPGRPPVRLVGWSFPLPHWTASPLANPPPPAAPDRLTLGVLHAELDVMASDYAPVSSGELAATGYTAWLLGHVHTPGTINDAGRPFYLGSLSGLDPTETGVHGPVLATIRPGARLSLLRLPLAPLRWVTAELDLTGAPRPAADLAVLVTGAMCDACAAAAVADDRALAMGIRLRLVGEVGDPEAVRNAAAAIMSEPPTTHTGRVAAFLDRLETDIRRACDLRALAAHATPPGLLARRLLVLEGAADVPGVADGAARREELLREARRCLAEADAIGQYRALRDACTNAEALAAATEVARRLLERFLPQATATPVPGRGERSGRASDQD